MNNNRLSTNKSKKDEITNYELLLNKAKNILSGSSNFEVYRLLLLDRRPKANGKIFIKSKKEFVCTQKRKW